MTYNNNNNIIIINKNSFDACEYTRIWQTIVYYNNIIFGRKKQIFICKVMSAILVLFSPRNYIIYKL